MNRPDIIISDGDLSRLDALLSGDLIERLGSVGGFLVTELARAQVLPARKVPASVVAMHSTVEFRDNLSGTTMVATLVYPHDSAGRERSISILTPVGAALLGLSEGQSIAYETPDGRCRTLTVIKVIETHAHNDGAHIRLMDG